MHTTVETEIRSGLGVITLNRPQALNALSLDMIRSITSALLAWKNDDAVDAVLFCSSSERAFCAGGDIRFFHQVASGPRTGSALLEDFFTEEYTLNHLIHCYPKPTIALMDGIVMGGGMGISQGTQLRVITERTRMGMPEVGIGLFPDVGGGYFLSRCPGQAGTWLALTGQIINAADALETGLADIAIAHSRVGEAMHLLTEARPGNRLQVFRDAFASSSEFLDSGSAMVVTHRSMIDANFDFDDMNSIIEALANDGSEFALEAISQMQHRSPLMLCVTLEQLRRAKDRSIAEVLRLERTMVRHCFEKGEVIEGIRSRVIDKDNAPRWMHASVADVTAEEVAQLFAQVWPDHAHPLRMLS